uniref:BESS domain-containing protein n=1 Tax=Parastrongyloides trichosuri TaxID=131310 RepID=A0A0N4Z0T6_PARTI
MNREMRTCNDNCKCELEKKYGPIEVRTQEVKVKKKPRSRMYRFLARICPCAFGDDEGYQTGLLNDDAYTPTQQVRQHRISETNNTIHSDQSRRTGSQNSYNYANRNSNNPMNSQYRISTREIDPDDDEYQIQQVLLRARENILTSDDFAYGIDQMPDFESKIHLYKEEFAKHDSKIRRSPKDNLKPPQLLLEEDDKYIDLLNKASPIPEKESERIFNILKQLNASFVKMNTIEFDEPLVVHMKL